MRWQWDDTEIVGGAIIIWGMILAGLIAMGVFSG